MLREGMSGLSDEGRTNLAKLMHIEPAGRAIPSTPYYSGLLHFVIPLISIITRSVSYTHLRAHETEADLV